MQMSQNNINFYLVHKFTCCNRFFSKRDQTTERTVHLDGVSRRARVHCPVHGFLRANNERANKKTTTKKQKTNYATIGNVFPILN